MYRWLITAAFLCALTQGCSQSNLGHDLSGLPNFGEVTPDLLYRGAQPSEQGIAALKEKGVKTVVNLRDDYDPDEKRWVESAGLQYVQIPSNANRPVDADVRKFLALMADRKRATPPADAATGKVTLATPAKPDPVFVHCAVGKDRTGLFVAAYRVALDNKKVTDALAEMDDYGHVPAWFPKLQPFIVAHAAAWRAAMQPPESASK